MNDTEFDAALVSAAFAQAGLTGWGSLSIVEAARTVGLPLDRARARFPGPLAVLLRFGLIADAAALADEPSEPTARARLFDLLMRRFDVLQQHREGVLALFRALPLQPLTTLTLGAATTRSMGWILEAAGIEASGLQGQVKANGLVAVWLYTLRAWRKDDSADMAGTMVALDKALDQAERVSGWLGRSAPADDAVVDEAMEGVVDLPDDAPMPADVADVVAAANPPPPPAPEPPGSPS